MRRFALLVIALTIGLVACRDETTAPRGEAAPPLTQQGQGTLDGRIHVQWGDPRFGAGSVRLRYELVDDGGQTTELAMDSVLAHRFGGPRGLDRKRVRIRGEAAGPRRLSVHAIELAGAVAAEPAAVTGSRAYITIGCKFSDIAAEPRTIAQYRDWTASSSYPGLNHYWLEQSFNQMNVEGSTTVGWFTLPFPRDHYISSGGADLQALLTDCTGAADPVVNFPFYFGINLQFNADLDCCSWGGGSTLTLDGQTKGYGVTWMAGWADLSTYAHEEGHSLGLPHSSGPYGDTYDSPWDVMSSNCTLYDWSMSSCIPQHTIGFHKAMLGWADAAHIFTAPPNASQSITLERLAQPGTTTGHYLVAYIPLQSSSAFPAYSVEARRLVGYDSNVPGNAIVLHRVDGTATVVDVDNNGDVSDQGAQWTVGETFTDAPLGIRMTVNAMTATGFQVTITRGPPGDVWAARSSMPSARHQPVAAATAGMLFAIGGLNSGGTAQRGVFAYDPVSNSWSTKAQLPAARYNGNGAAAINGKIYVPGGFDATNALTRTLYVYTAATNTWTTKAAMPVPGGCGGSAAIDGKLYVFTGCTRSSTGVQSSARLLHRYDPATNTWTTRQAAPVTHYSPVVAAVGGKLYVAGGNTATNGQTARLDVYNPATNTWVTMQPMPTARVAAGGGSIRGLLYVAGGRSGSTYLRSVDAYDPLSDTWSSRTPVPTARAGVGSSFISIAGRFYVVGGRNSSVLATNEEYTP
jgi:N-acetylneuraminic acid mutarotase